MKTVTTYRGAHAVTDYKPEAKNSMVKPQIKKEYHQNGQRMYKTTDGRTFIADVFDHNFNQGVKLKMKGKNFKATSLDPRTIY